MKKAEIMGQAYTDVLTPAKQNALHLACILLTDSFFFDIVQLGSRQIFFNETEMIHYLPRRFLPEYTQAFAYKFIVVFSTLCWKLAQPQRLPLSSLAEEVAMLVLTQEATFQLDIDRAEIDEEAVNEGDREILLAEASENEGPFSHYWDLLAAILADTNVMMLFDDQLHRINDTELAQKMGIPTLSLEDWFRPFANQRETEFGTVHPYVEGDYDEEDDE